MDDDEDLETTKRVEGADNHCRAGKGFSSTDKNLSMTSFITVVI